MCHDKVEDETHFLTECRLYGSLYRLWEEIQEQVPHLNTLNSSQKFEFVMIQEDPEVTVKVLQMVYKLTIFRKFIYETFYQQ